MTWQYVYAGGKLIQQSSDSLVMDFFYDENGRPFAMRYNGRLLYYLLNLQGDVIKLIAEDGTNFGTYRYDAWGNVIYTSNTKYTQNNPLRYRGYVYDNETGLYYLQSRYYDPKIGRFINADSYASTGQGLLGNNMFAYCGNNPVMYSDPCGSRFSPWHEDVTMVCLEFQDRREYTLGDYFSGTPAFGEYTEEVEKIMEDIREEDYPEHVGASLGAIKIYSGTKNVVKGFGLCFLPEPTILAELAGIGIMIWGSIQTIQGVGQFIFSWEE